MLISRALCLGFFLTACLCCAHRPERAMPRKDINVVLRENDKELMSLPGVVGVYVGMLDDGKTLCLKVMVEKKTPELERRLPKQLEGYRVLIEESGPIRPMRKPTG